jgi:hypothetical protein
MATLSEGWPCAGSMPRGGVVTSSERWSCARACTTPIARRGSASPATAAVGEADLFLANNRQLSAILYFATLQNMFADFEEREFCRWNAAFRDCSAVTQAIGEQAKPQLKQTEVTAIRPMDAVTPAQFAAPGA